MRLNELTQELRKMAVSVGPLGPDVVTSAEALLRLPRYFCDPDATSQLAADIAEIVRGLPDAEDRLFGEFLFSLRSPGTSISQRRSDFERARGKGVSGATRAKWELHVLDQVAFELHNLASHGQSGHVRDQYLGRDDPRDAWQRVDFAVALAQTAPQSYQLTTFGRYRALVRGLRVHHVASTWSGSGKLHPAVSRLDDARHLATTEVVDPETYARDFYTCFFLLQEPRPGDLYNLHFDEEYEPSEAFSHYISLHPVYDEIGRVATRTEGVVAIDFDRWDGTRWMRIAQSAYLTSTADGTTSLEVEKFGTVARFTGRDDPLPEVDKGSVAVRCVRRELRDGRRIRLRWGNLLTNKEASTYGSLGLGEIIQTS